jgi:hypothetical protein
MPPRQAKYIIGGTAVEVYNMTLFLDCIVGMARDGPEAYSLLFAVNLRKQAKRSSGVLSQIVSHLQWHVLNLRLHISKKGYAGLYPIPTQAKGIVFGCSVPVLLRRVEERYGLLESVMFMGIIDGEAIKMLDDGELTREECHLQ